MHIDVIRPYARYALLALLLLAIPAAARAEIMKLDEVRKGMKGYGLTVFDGQNVERFDVEILGVLRNVSPGQDLILAHVDSDVIQESGVIAGMSGSPVYIDGKVIGALAYSWQFSRDSVAGITPIEAMLRIPTSHRDAIGRPVTPVPASTFATFLSSGDPTEAFDALTSSWQQRSTRTAASGALPISTPLSVGNFGSATLDRFSSVLQSAGFLAVPAGSAGSEVSAEEPFRPGDAVSAVLVEGDFSLAANGTVTHVDGEKVYGFGHPFLDMGPIAFPMARAEVVGVLPSLAQSFKFSNTGPIVGTFVQDRGAGIMGLVGTSPEMIPVQFTLHGGPGDEVFDLRIVNHAELFPLLLAMSTDAVITGAERSAGDRSIHMDLALNLEDGRTVTINEGWTGTQARGMIPMYLAVLVNYITANAFDPVEVKSVDIDLRHSDERQAAQLIEAALVTPESGPIRPGSELTVRATLRTWRGENVVHELPLTVPSDAQPGPAFVIVGSGTVDNQVRFSLVPPDPRSVGDLIELVSGLRPSTTLAARLLLPNEGRVSGGSYHPGLPPSIAAVIDNDSSNSATKKVRLHPSHGATLELDRVISGATRIDFRIEPRT